MPVKETAFAGLGAIVKLGGTLKRKLQVFISSTFTDLVEERQAAVAAILKEGHIPAGMELFTAGDRSQMATINEWIDESDVYMLILGGRYGSIERTSGVSYTELEYNYAVQQGKPLFAVVIDEDALEQKVRNGGSSFIERNNPKELALFREKVLCNISSFFKDQKDIRLSVHESLADLSSSRDMKGWISGAEVADTKPLLDEISKLSEENRSLRDTIDRLEKRSSMTMSVDKVGKVTTYDETRKILESIQIKIPPNLIKRENASKSLFDLFFNNKDILINGITNASDASEASLFFYHNVCPKLQTHGLVENEKVTGVRYRRSYVSSAGKAFLAETERRLLLASTRKKSSKKKSVSVR